MDRDIENWFTYHPPGPEETIRYENLRLLGKALADGISANCPMCADTSAAIRKVREAVMTANAAIACAPRVTGVMGYSPAPDIQQECIRKMRDLEEEKQQFSGLGQTEPR